MYDWCSYFPERWPRWIKPWKWEIVDISEGCKKHDDNDDPKGGCASHEFAKWLLQNRIVCGIIIFVVASLACWIKYPYKMWKRI